MNTQDLSEFGYREIAMGRDLLTAYLDNNQTQNMDSGIKIEFNPNSGNVFLVDGDYNAAMMNGDKLCDWYSCPICGHEGFKEDMNHNEDVVGFNEECQEYLNDIGFNS